MSGFRVPRDGAGTRGTNQDPAGRIGELYTCTPLYILTSVPEVYEHAYLAASIINCSFVIETKRLIAAENKQNITSPTNKASRRR